MNAEQIFEITSLLYSKWSDAEKVLLDVQKEVDDGTPDWQLFHNERVTSAKANCDRAWQLYCSFQSVYRAQLKSMLA